MKNLKSLIAVFLVLVITVSNLPIQVGAVNGIQARNGFGCEDGHAWQEANCEEPKYCLYCGTFVGMPLGHSMGDWITEKEATCTSDGEIRMYCRRDNCDYFVKEVIPASHMYTETVTEATCTQKGYTTHTCASCGVNYVDSYVPAWGHDWQEATCEAPKFCQTCGTFEGTPLDHNMGDWKVLSAATCTADGKMRRACSRCEYVETEVIPANGHMHMPVVTEATCTQKGYTTHTCTACGDSYVDSYVAAWGHNWQKATCETPKFCQTCGAFEGMPLDHDMSQWKTVSEATCTAEGKMRRACSRCDYDETETIPANGHIEMPDAAVEATCTVNGKTAGSHCSVCNTVIKAQTVIPAAHTYSHIYDYKCDICGKERIVDMTRPMVDMFRMYDPNSGEHFYTGSIEERENLVAVGWNYEGVGFTFPLTTGDPVHRLYDPITGEHLYTMNVEEMNALLDAGWNYEGIAFNSGFENEVPQYRLHNPNETRGAYHFTASIEEKDSLIAAGWEYQGIGWYSLGA